MSLRRHPLAFDPNMLPDPAALRQMRELSVRGRQTQPLESAEWYTPTLQFGQSGLPLSIATASGVIGIWGRFADRFTVPIPVGIDTAVFDVVYTNFDDATLYVAQGSPIDYINYTAFPRGPTGAHETFSFSIDTSDLAPAHQLLTYWTWSQSPFGGFWAGQLGWLNSLGSGGGVPTPPPLLGRVGVVPVIADCTPIAWTLSSYSPGSLSLRLMYANYAPNPLYTLLSTDHAPELTPTDNARRNHYQETPYISGWEPFLLREGEIEVWVDAAIGVDQCELVLYLRKL